MKLLDLVRRDAIIAELASEDRSAAIRELVQCLADAGALSAEQVESVVRSIVARERSRGTTGFGMGVAAPHAKLAGLPGVVAAVGRSARGIDFAALDGKPVHCVFLVLSPDEQPDEHLRAMDLVFRHLRHERFRKFLRQAEGADQIYELLKEADEKSLVG